MTEDVVSLSGGLEEAPMKVAITAVVLSEGVRAALDSSVAVDANPV